MQRGKNVAKGKAHQVANSLVHIVLPLFKYVAEETQGLECLASTLCCGCGSGGGGGGGCGCGCGLLWLWLWLWLALAVAVDVTVAVPVPVPVAVVVPWLASSSEPTGKSTREAMHGLCHGNS